VGVVAYKKGCFNGVFFATVVFHASELRLLFGPVPAPGLELEFANTMLDFYIKFVSDLNPGRMYFFQFFRFWGSVCAAIYPVVASRPQYDPDSKQVLQLQRDNITSITDGAPQLRLRALSLPVPYDTPHT
jgi:hypothetical protein